MEIIEYERDFGWLVVLPSRYVAALLYLLLLNNL